jgi:hypothetical protein
MFFIPDNGRDRPEPDEPATTIEAEAEREGEVA